MRSAKFMAVALLLCGISVLAATGLAAVLRPGAPRPRTSLKMPPGLFAGWKKPDLVLVLSAQQHGYLLPCGCSTPQTGGLERRYNLVQLLAARGWPVAAVDLGDVAQREGPRKLPNVQGLVKYRTSMEALDRMGYLAVGLGEYEAALSLTTALAEYALNNKSPRVLAANLKDKDRDFPEQVGNAVVKEVAGSGLRLGVGGLVGPSVQDAIKGPAAKFDDNRRVVPRLAADLKQAADLVVLLYQGSLAEAKALAGARKDFHIVLCLSPADDDLPRSEPVWEGDTLLTSLGHKARHVGVVGVWRTGKPKKPFEFRYQLVTLGPEFATPDDEVAGHPILDKMEQYTRELKDHNYLGQYGQRKHPNQLALPDAYPKYEGSDKCQKCHETAYDKWEKSKHAHAYDALVKATRPSLRQHDAECIVCHTVGFGYDSGYKNATETPHLKNVGCESCHGPGSEHVKKPRDERWYRLLNPWKAKPDETAAEKRQRELRIDTFCQSCHDIDNDSHYKFKDRWPPIAHPTYAE